MKRIAAVVFLLGLLGLPGYSGAELSIPSGVTATEGTYSDVIVIAWNSVPDASGYEVWRSSYTCRGADPCEPYFNIMGVVDSPIYYDSDDIMPFGEIFEYKILAFNYFEWSDFSLSAFGSVSESSPSYGPELPVNNYSSGGCFIATAAYGSYLEPHVMTLRQFKDTHLLTNKPGTRFVQAYYRYSPPIADYIAAHDILRSVVRLVLAPAVLFSWVALNYGMMSALAVLSGMLTMFLGGACFIATVKKN